MTAASAGSQLARPEPPAAVWRALAPLVSAPGRRSMRVYDAADGSFSRAVKLTGALPSSPAATYLYTKTGRTQLLALDFDVARGDRAAVEADLATATEWVIRCGGVVVTDHSPGGAHLLCPLAIGTTAGVDEITHLVRLLEARLPTLDKTPNCNAASGCLSVPGSPAKQGGGYRQLDGPLAAAIEAFTTRSAATLLPRLYELLGAVKPRPAATHPAAGATTQTITVADYCEGEGDDRRLAPAWVRADPLHPDVVAYAQFGVMATGQRQWPSHSEARMAVVTAAIARGHSLASITALIAPGAPWHTGLGQAYTRYRHHSDTALSRDFSTALRWLATNVLPHRHRQHEKKYTQGGATGARSGSRGPLALRRWLAAALRWSDVQYRGKRGRGVVQAVLQALAFHAYVAGEPINGVWVVGVGGRSLSLGTGLLSADVVWRVLRELRELPGSPLILARTHVGVDADHYALTRPAGFTASHAAVARVRVEPVHDAWSVLGHHLRRVFELVAYHDITTRADLYAAAAVSSSAGDEAVTALCIAGLLTRPARGCVAVGPVSLDSVAAAHDTDGLRSARIVRYRAEREQWRQWLVEQVADSEAARADAIVAAAPAEHPDVDTTFWASAFERGPPVDPAAEDGIDYEQGIDTALAVLGGRIVALASSASPC